jgi:MYXO-CTERM domain-containing protein
MSHSAATRPLPRAVPWPRIGAALRSEVGLARLAFALVALHVADDNLLQPNAGTSAADHLFAGFVPLALLALAAWFYPRLRAGARASVALVVGFMAILGATEAVYYTRAAGPSGDDYSGLLSIPAAFLLLGLGAVTLWRSRRRDDALWWRYGRRMLLTAGTALALFVIAQPVALSYIVTHAGKAQVPAANLGAPHENVEFTTSDGLRLKGWYVPSRNGAAVIAFAGRRDTQLRARMLVRHGYGVLLFDRRGEGESEGDPNLFGWQGERDVHGAVAFLQHRSDVDPQRIGAIGLSVGGEMLIEAAAESPALKAIVTEGASFRSVRDTLVNPERKWDSVIIMGIATAATALFTDNLPPATLRSLVPKIGNRSVFFIYGEKGQPEEKPANTGFYELARGPKEIWEVPDAEHMNGAQAHPKEYERRIVAFFDRALLKPAA